MASKKSSTGKFGALTDLGRAMAQVFKKYSRHASGAAWKDLKSPRGDRVVKQIIRNPSRPLNQFVKLAFKEWIENHGEK